MAVTSSGNSELAEYVRLRAPKEHGETLQLPPISAAAAIVDSNRNVLAGYSDDLQAIRSLAHKEVKDLALAYSKRYLPESPLSEGGSDSIVMSGHQPTLFHPGVWFKNFALDSIARRTKAIAINLVVDNDLCADVAVRLPPKTDGSPAESRGSYASMDRPDREVPHEMRQICDADAFRGFRKVVVGSLSGVIDSPLIDELWPEVVEASKTIQSLSASVAAGRHRLEHKHGLANLELPVSVLATSEAFARFFERLVFDASRFLQIYNEELQAFRRVNRIRSRSHPVPELESDDGYIELPFWIWTKENPQRRRLFAKTDSRKVELSDRADWSVELGSENFFASFQELNQLGSEVFIRPRALTTTMFSRMFASDLFIHGIGGAKYDQLGDEIARRFFEVTPPQFVTISATLRLPLEASSNVDDQIAKSKTQLRRLRFHPDLELPDDPRSTRKMELIRNRPESGSRKSWHDEIAAINAGLSAELEPKRLEIEQRLAHAKKELPISRLLNSREFSFALFPVSLIQQLKDLVS